MLWNNVFGKCHCQACLNMNWFAHIFLAICKDENYMATILHTLWLAADWARFPFNDWALLPWCPRHKQSLFNLIVDIHITVDWQLSKKIHWPVSHDCIMGSSVQLIEVTCFLTVICWPLVVFSKPIIIICDYRPNYFQCFLIIVRASDISRSRGPTKFRYFREIPKTTRNTAKSTRNISKYMSAKHI